MPTQEIERRWLASLSGSPEGAAERMVQGYFSTGSPAIRIRMIDDTTYIVTFKSGGGLVRAEVEVPLDSEKGADVLAMSSHTVEKTRYTVDDWEVDIFHGPLEGLVIVEREFPSEAAANGPLPPFPSFIHQPIEITGEKEWSNQALAFMANDEASAAVRRAQRLLATGRAGPRGKRPSYTLEGGDSLRDDGDFD